MGSPPYRQPPVQHSDFRDKPLCISTYWVRGDEKPTRRCTRIPLWALVANKASGLKPEKDGLANELLNEHMSEGRREQKILRVAEISMCRQCGQDFDRKEKVADNISASINALLKRSAPRIENRRETPLAPTRPLRAATTHRQAHSYDTPRPHLRGGGFSNTITSPGTPASSVTFGRQSPDPSLSSSISGSHPVFGKPIRNEAGFSKVNVFQNGSKAKRSARVQSPASDETPTPLACSGFRIRSPPKSSHETSASVSNTSMKSTRETQLQAQVTRLEHQLRIKDDDIEALRRQNRELEVEAKTWKYRFRSMLRLTKAKLDVLDTATRGLSDDLSGVEWSEGVESDDE